MLNIEEQRVRLSVDIFHKKKMQATRQLNNIFKNPFKKSTVNL